MKLRVFQANKGDCLLLTAADGSNLLIDGGLKGSFQDHVRPALAELAENGGVLDLVCVSHIDEDHIAGIVQLMDDILDWRVFKFQRDNGNDLFKEPDFEEPPAVSNVWHNGFGTQASVEPGLVEQIMGLRILAAVIDGNRGLAEREQALITGERQALELSYRLEPEQLNIPLNAPFGGQPVALDEQPLSQPLGSMNLHLLGPFRADLDALEAQWEKWVRENEKVIRDLQGEAEEDAARLRLSEGESLRRMLQLLATELGERSDVTVPNLASIMLLAEEDGKTILLTGDGHWEDILKGLRLHGRIDDQAGIHVDVLKLQHHGAEANIAAEFCQFITADHTIICANGSDDNPELVVLELIVDSRVGAAAAESKSPGVDRPFKLWFNSSEQAANTDKRKAHMRAVEERVTALAADSGGKMSFFFLGDASSFEIGL